MHFASGEKVQHWKRKAVPRFLEDAAQLPGRIQRRQKIIRNERLNRDTREIGEQDNSQGYKMKTVKGTLLLTHLWCSDRRRSRPPSNHRWAPSRLEDRRRRSGRGRGARTRSPSSSGPPKGERTG